MTARGTGEVGAVLADDEDRPYADAVVTPGVPTLDEPAGGVLPGAALPDRLRALVDLVPEAYRALVAKLVRYALTSGVALGVSEATLLVLYGTGAVGATAAALIANVVATVPSYLLSRYWIWARAERTRVGRQVVLYWATSAVSIALLSLSTGLVARLAPAGRPIHLLVVAVAFPLLNLLFWVAKFVVYQRVIFLERGRGTATDDDAEALPDRAA